MTRAVARTAHEIPERAPVRLLVDERVTVVRRDTEWPAFVFVETASGEGWVPSRHLSTDAGPATVRTPYDTTELPTVAGEPLSVIEQDPASGWSWCSNGDGRAGWVPDRTITLLGGSSDTANLVLSVDGESLAETVHAEFRLNTEPNLPTRNRHVRSRSWGDWMDGPP